MAREVERFIGEQLENLPVDHPDRNFLSETLQVTRAYNSQDPSEIEPSRRPLKSFERKKDIAIFYSSLVLIPTLVAIARYTGDDNVQLGASLSGLPAIASLFFPSIRQIIEQAKWERRHQNIRKSSQTS